MKQIKPLAASWARSFLAAVLAMYMAGITDPMTGKAVAIGATIAGATGRIAGGAERDISDF